MIKMQVIGNLGRDCTVNTVNGRSVMNFTVAHTERFKDAQGVMKDKTIWVDCAYWTDRTAVAPYLKKGTQVYVDGMPDVRTYTTSDGRNGASLTLRVSSVQLLGNRSGDGGDGGNSNMGGSDEGANTGSNYNAGPGNMESATDDLPF